MIAAARRLQAGGALLLATGIAIGAVGAHVLKSRLPPDRFDVLQTAVLYQLICGLGLLCVGLALAQAAARAGARLLAAGGHLALIGAVLFSGSLYLLLAGAPRLLGAVTPLGGLCLILGWIVVAVGFLRQRAHD
jgi:uncharacterized membrane protein YgdD (TMEM256/DUF423 family)